MYSPFRQMLADRPCDRALQSAKQKLLSAPLHARQCRKASAPGALFVLLLYLLCAASAAGFFNLEILFSVFGRPLRTKYGSLLKPVSRQFHFQISLPQRLSQDGQKLASALLQASNIKEIDVGA
jgi:hypothetical protein